MNLQIIFQEVNRWYEQGGFTYHCQLCGKPIEIGITTKISPCICKKIYWTDELIIFAIKEVCEKARYREQADAKGG